MPLFILHHLYQYMKLSSPTFLAVALLLFTTLTLYFVSRVRRSSSKRTHLPPSPSKLPFVGNLHQMGSVPHRSLRALSDKHGPLMLLQMGKTLLLVVSSPDMAQEVMKTQDHIFANRPSLVVPKTIFNDGRDIAFAPYGAHWRHARKISVLHLLSSKKVHSYRLVREDEVTFMIERIGRSSSPVLVDVSETLNSLAKDVICRVALGKCSRESRWNNDISCVIEESSRMIGTFHWGDYFPWLAWLSTGLDERVKAVTARIQVILNEIIEEHINQPSRGEDCENYDFVDILLALEKDPNADLSLDKEIIKAVITDILGAGIDTTNITMEWVMAELLRNPKVMKKLQDEITKITGGPRTVIREEELMEMNYLKAVIKESLRLHPPATLLLPRELMQDTKIQGYEIPKHTRVIINVWAIGRDPNVWDEPEEFRPERFMGSTVDFIGHDFQFTPFGAGRRMCPGIKLATTIVELAIANLVHRFDWELPDGMKGEHLDMTETPGLSNRKKEHLCLTATPRLY